MFSKYAFLLTVQFRKFLKLTSKFGYWYLASIHTSEFVYQQIKNLSVSL